MNIYAFEKTNRLIVAHDPFVKGEDFNNFIKYFNHKFLIINSKSEGIEKKIYSILKKRKINNFFFLDTSFPFIYKYSKYLTKKFAIRVSDIESPLTLLNSGIKTNWIWLDCFNNFNINLKVLKKIKKLNYKICVVSPTLHKRKITKKDLEFFKKLKKLRIKVDMICEKRKNINFWNQFFNTF